MFLKQKQKIRLMAVLGVCFFCLLVLLPGTVSAATTSFKIKILPAEKDKDKDKDKVNAVPFLPKIELADTSVAFSGKAFPNAKVMALRDGQATASASCSDSADFYLKMEGLPEGSYNFSLYAQDGSGRRSSLLNVPAKITKDTLTQITDILLSPTIDTDKSQVKQGDSIKIFGQSIPQGKVTIFVNSQPAKEVSADDRGNYSYDLATRGFGLGILGVKSKISLGEANSDFSETATFAIGRENVLKKPMASFGRGDVNKDSRVNLVDFSVAAYWYKRPNPPPEADINGDGKVDLVDFSIMAYNWTG